MTSTSSAGAVQEAAGLSAMKKESNDVCEGSKRQREVRRESDRDADRRTSREEGKYSAVSDDEDFQRTASC